MPCALSSGLRRGAYGGHVEKGIWRTETYGAGLQKTAEPYVGEKTQQVLLGGNHVGCSVFVAS